VAKTTLTTLGRTMADVVALLPKHHQFALVGGLAVSARTSVRFTKDIDFAVAVDSDTAAEQVVFAMQRSGYLIETIIQHRNSGRLATARLCRSPTDPMVDLLFAASGIEPEVTADATTISVLKHPVPVAAVGHLIAMKLVSTDDDRRPHDRSDLVQLSKAADDTEWARAEIAVRLIAERGFARGRDLAAALQEWRERARVIASDA
jgi:hypothetical protein